MFARFSTVGGEKGSADTARDPRGFALKFYTEDGNWDLVGNNTPVFFIKDAKKFPDFIHTQKRVPKTNLKSATMMWDFWSLNPESLHQVLILMSDRGTPHGYRHMHGFGSHTFSMINAANERVWVKFHLKTKQGIKNFSHDEAVKMKGENPDFAQEDLVDAIENGNFPKWTMYIQVMTEEQAKELILIKLFDLIHTELLRYLNAEKRALIQSIENLWDKYAVSKTQLEAKKVESLNQIDGFLKELYDVLNGAVGENLRFEDGASVFVYTSCARSIENYENFERNIRFGSDLPVHSFRACQKIFNLCKENHYDLHMSENTMLGETIKSDARAELLNVLRKTGERRKMNDGTGK